MHQEATGRKADLGSARAGLEPIPYASQSCDASLAALSETVLKENAQDERYAIQIGA
jgi:hypothetical protein